MNAQPLVSVVIACYNSMRYLKPAIDSVLAQTYRNIELLLVDDCSSDGTVACIREYQQRDPRVRLVQREARGGRPAITKNTALEHIRGDFVCFLDHDDYYHPDKIATLLALLQANPQCVAAFHDVDLVDGDGKFLNRYLDKFVIEAAAYLTPLPAEGAYLCGERFYAFQSVHYAAIHTISVMINVERFGRERLSFDTQYQVCDDTDLWIRLGLAGTMAYVDRSLASYRLHGSNITSNGIKVKVDALRLMESNFPRVQALINDGERQALRSRVINSYSDLGWAYRCDASSWKAVAAYLRAWKWSRGGRFLLYAAKALFPPREA